MKKTLLVLTLSTLVMISSLPEAFAKNCYCQVSEGCEGAVAEAYGVIATYPWWKGGKKSDCSSECVGVVGPDMCNIHASADAYCINMSEGEHVLTAHSTEGESFTKYDSCDPDMYVGKLECALTCECPTGSSYDPSSNLCYISFGGTIFWTNPLSCQVRGSWSSFAASC